MKNLFIDSPGARANKRLEVFYLIAGIVVFSFFCVWVMDTSSGITLQGWKAVWKYREAFWHGWVETILLSVAALLLSTLFGIFLTTARRSSIIGLRALALLFIEVIRGTPLLTQILFFFYIVLTKWQTYRYVIVPQALRHLLPSLAGQFAAIIKDSSLLSVIGLSEFTLAAEQVNAVTYQTLESFFPLALGYLLLTLPISLGSRWLEKGLRYEN